MLSVFHSMYKLNIAGWSSLVARRAHNPKVVGSNPAPATNYNKAFRFFLKVLFFVFPDYFPTCLTDVIRFLLIFE